MVPRTPRHRPTRRAAIGVRGYTSPVQPLPPDGGSDPVPLAVGAPHRPPPVPAALRARRGRLRRRRRASTKHPKQRVPAQAKRPRPPAHVGGGQQEAGQRRHRADGPLADRRERQAGTLNWICNHNQPDHALEGFASQVSAVPGDDVAVFVSTHRPGRPGPGLPDGLLSGPRRPPHRRRPTSSRPRSRPRRSSRPASAR